MKLYRTGDGNFLEHPGHTHRVPEHRRDAPIARQDLGGYRVSVASGTERVTDIASLRPLAPIGRREAWAAGVTDYRSRDARMAESKDAGGGDFYDRVYSATRPELILAIDPRGRIIDHTLGNDMSSCDIEGENPLYLPQAKLYDRSCAVVFFGTTPPAELKRKPAELVDYLFRDHVFPTGVYLMTGTGIAPPDSFSLLAADRVRISLDAIGTLENTVVQGGL